MSPSDLSPGKLLFRSAITRASRWKELPSNDDNILPVCSFKCPIRFIAA